MSFILWLPNLGMGASSSGAPTASQFFEQALVSKLLSLSPVSDFIGSALFKTAIPQTRDLGAVGPCLTYEIPNKPFGHVLTGSDGTAKATAKISAWSYNYGTSKQLIEAVWSGLDGVPTTWGDGSCEIISVVQQDDDDEPIRPQAGSDQWIYRVNQTYQVMYRVLIPDLV